MKRQTVIIYCSPIPECYGNLKLFCDSKGLKYNTYSKIKLPFEYNGYMVHRVKFMSGKYENVIYTGVKVTKVFTGHLTMTKT